MSKCPFAIQVPGPELKRGYTFDGTRYHITHSKIGMTLHSAEYDLPNDDKVLWNALHGVRVASWPFTITKPPFAFIFQHFDPEDTCWHAGYSANLWTVGIELEGVAPAKVTGIQYDLLVRLMDWLSGELGWRNWDWHKGDIHNLFPMLGGCIFEHKQWMSTNCAVFSNKQLSFNQLVIDLEKEGTPVINWPYEKIRLFNSFMGWWTTFPENQEDKDYLMKAFKETGTNEEIRGFLAFWKEQLSWRAPK
uniref:Putative N-acetylmuramoyl-L-alanine amidase n=1 Tax=viral metagenome TaxID=1070528 RepID=A0A6H1ZL99_9ZZZZ